MMMPPSVRVVGSIPACAGEAAAFLCPQGLAEVYPRVCGGSAAAARRRSLMLGLSPRVRGKR